MLKATTDGATADAPPVNNVMPSFGVSKRSALKSGVREAFGGNSSNTEENEDIPRFSKRQFLRNMMLRSQKAKEKEKEKDNNGERQHRRQASTATRTATTDAAGRSEAKANATKVISTNNMVRKNNSPKVPEAQGLLPPPHSLHHQHLSYLTINCPHTRRHLAIPKPRQPHPPKK